MSNRTRDDILAEAEKSRVKGVLKNGRIQVAATVNADVFYEVSMLAELRGISLSELIEEFVEIQVAMEEELRDDEAAMLLWGDR